MTDTEPMLVQLSLPILAGIQPTGLLQLIRLAEDAGLDGAVCGEVAGVDATAILGAAAAVTDRLRLETNVLSVLSRSPSLLAMAASSLAELSGGRFVLGLGAGSPLVAGFHATSFDNPIGRVTRWLSALRRALAGDKLESFGSFRLSGIEPVAVPVMLAAINPKMLSLAGRFADGISLNLCGPDQVREYGDFARQAAREAGRTERFEIHTMLWLDGTGDAQRARELFALEMAPYLAVPTYRRTVVALSDEDAIDRAISALGSGGRRAAAAVFPEPILDALVATDRADARNKIVSFAAAGCSGIRVHPLVRAGHSEDALAAIALTADALADARVSPGRIVLDLDAGKGA